MPSGPRVVLSPPRALQIAAPVLVPARTAGLMAATTGLFVAARVHQALSSPSERPRVFARYQQRWFRFLLELFGVRVSLAGDPDQGLGRGRMVVSNHRSAVDVAVIGWLFGGSLLSKADLGRWPLLGTVARAAGTIFVDRQVSASGAAAVRAIRGRLVGGATVSLFPEGTTFADDHVRPFRRGAFIAASQSGCLVVPVGLAYDSSGRALFIEPTFAEHVRHLAATPRLTVAVRVGKAIEAEGVPAARLAALAEQAVQALTIEARQDCRELERER